MQPFFPQVSASFNMAFILWEFYLFVCFKSEAWLLQKQLWASGLVFLLFFSWSNHHVYRSECTPYNQKCVSFSVESLWLPNTTQMVVWGTVSPNGNTELAEMFPWGTCQKPADITRIEKYLTTVIAWVVRNVAFTDIYLISLFCP